VVGEDELDHVAGGGAAEIDRAVGHGRHATTGRPPTIS
jgi:hypothetical protein